MQYACRQVVIEPFLPIKPITWPRTFVILLLVLLICGCRSVPTAVEIPQFRQGVATADQATSQAFAEINAFDRQRMIDVAVSKDRLSEENFQFVLDTGSTAKWKRAFGLMDEYAKLLQELLDPKQRDGVEKELVELGTKIGNVNGEDLPSGVVAGFASLSGLLVQMKADKDALAAIRMADPGVAATFSEMAKAIGDDDMSGVRGQNHAAWDQVLKDRVISFSSANDPRLRREIASQYVQDLDARDASDQSLQSIVRSLTLLSEAHSELAAGRTQGAGSLLELVTTEYARWGAIKSDIDKARKKAAGESGQ